MLRLNNRLSRPSRRPACLCCALRLVAGVHRDSAGRSGQPRYAQASKQMMEKETISTSGFRSRLATFSRPASTGSKSRRPRSLVTGPKLQSGFTDCRPFWRRRRQLSSLIGWHCRLQGLSVRSLPRYFYALHSPWCRGAACENGRGVARLHPERDRISGARLLRVG